MTTGVMNGVGAASRVMRCTVRASTKTPCRSGRYATPTLLDDYAWWWLGRQSRLSTESPFIRYGSNMKTIARYWLENAQGTRGDEPLAREIPT